MQLKKKRKKEIVEEIVLTSPHPRIKGVSLINKVLLIKALGEFPASPPSFDESAFMKYIKYESKFVG